MKIWRFLLFLLFSAGLAAAQSTAGPFTISSGTSPCATIGTTGYSTVGINVAGTFTATLQPEVSIRGQAAANTQVTPSTSSTAQGTITGVGIFTAQVAGYDQFLVCVTAYTSGTATIFLNATKAIATSGGGGSGGLPAGLTFVAPTLTVSTAGSGNGQLALSGNTSGAATLTAPAVAGTATNPITSSNALVAATGTTCANDSIGIGAQNDGFYFDASNQFPLVICNQGAATFGVYNGGGVRTLSTGPYGWTSGALINAVADTALSRDAAGVVDVGTGASGNSAGVLKAAAVRGGGAAAGLAGTGACATITTQTGGSSVGQATCTGTTGASTLTITPGTTAPNGWVCVVQDQTTRANALQQTANTATTCTLTATSVTQNDVFVFTAMQF